MQAYLYDVDARGNRTRTREVTPRTTGSGTNTTIAATDAGIVYTGMWQADGSFQRSTAATARLGLLFFGTTGIELTMGTGPDHSRFDVYIDGSLWQAFDGYAATAGERTIPLELTGAGVHLLEIRNRREKSASSSGYVVRFKQLVAQAAYNVRQMDYQYDAPSRLIAADYADNSREYAYLYDVAGNRRQEQVTIGITTTTTNWTYNAANQIATQQIGGNPATNFSYDANGNLTSDGTNSYTWDRANRLLSMGGIAYAYNGDGNRVSQTANSIVTRYLLDTQPGLALVIAQTTGANTERYIHAPRGIHAIENSLGAWSYQMQDGLGSVRGVVDAGGLVTQSIGYSPYGVPDSNYDWAFTGEQRDGTGIQYHRARYYAPGIGNWISLDPLETNNRYAYVSGNVVNRVDPLGLFDWCNTEFQHGDTLYNSIYIELSKELTYLELDDFITIIRDSNQYHPVFFGADPSNPHWASQVINPQSDWGPIWLPDQWRQAGLRASGQSCITPTPTAQATTTPTPPPTATTTPTSTLTNTPTYVPPTPTMYATCCESPTPTPKCPPGEQNLHQLRVRSQGHICGVAAYLFYGGGIYIMDMWDVNSDRFMRYIIPQVGVGGGLELQGIAALLGLGTCQNVWSEFTLDEIAWGTSIQGDIVIGFFASSYSQDVKEGTRFASEGECIEMTTSSGVGLGLQASISLVGAWVNYDSNWSK